MSAPARVVEDPALEAVVDEKHADRLCEASADRLVGDRLSSKAEPPPIAAPDDIALEVVAALHEQLGAASPA
ncbi:hypothetical protein ACWD26_31700 [Streptomyces sp. NPDC002787]